MNIPEELEYCKMCSECKYFYYSGYPDLWYIVDQNKPENHRCQNIRFNSIGLSLCQDTYKVCVKAILGAKPEVIEIDRFELIDFDE